MESLRQLVQETEALALAEAEELSWLQSVRLDGAVAAADSADTLPAGLSLQPLVFGDIARSDTGTSCTPRSAKRRLVERPPPD